MTPWFRIQRKKRRWRRERRKTVLILVLSRKELLKGISLVNICCVLASWFGHDGKNGDEVGLDVNVTRYLMGRQRINGFRIDINAFCLGYMMKVTEGGGERDGPSYWLVCMFVTCYLMGNCTLVSVSIYAPLKVTARWGERDGPSYWLISMLMLSDGELLTGFRIDKCSGYAHG